VTEPRYRIGTLAQLTGITTHALRVWERRYGALTPTRTPGGARRYSEQDVRRLRVVKKLLDSGYNISAIATLDLAELTRLTSSDAREVQAPAATLPTGRARELIDDLVGAVAELDLERASRVLTQASNAFSPRELVPNVLAPALEEIGRFWESGELCIASEHAASALLRTHIGALLVAQPVSGKAPVICTTPAGEHHELGALLAAVVVAMLGRRVLYLGPNLPAAQISEAVRLSGARSVALSLVGLGPEAARRELDELCEILPEGVQLLLGGRGAANLVGLPERVQLLGSLRDLESWLGSAPD
jgi:DNA-binding transcriptional MerR regulator